MTRQLEEVENYWREVLKRIIGVITFICECGLALRGGNETIGSPNNCNYLGMLEFIAEYDDFLRQHIQEHANRGSGHTNDHQRSLNSRGSVCCLRSCHISKNQHITQYH